MFNFFVKISFLALSQLLIFNYSAVSQTILGKVINEKTYEPLSLVNIRIDELNLGTTSNHIGEFKLHLDSGPHKISFSLLGYEKKVIEIPQVSDLAADTLVVQLVELIGIPLPGVEIVGERNRAYRFYSGVFHTVGKKEIDLFKPVGTEEVLKKLPGLNIASDDGISNRVNIGIRGLYPRRSSRVLIMEDGVPVNPTIYIDPATYYNSPIDRIDGIEVIKGSSALRFGPQTMGGVINYLTNKPSFDPRLNFTLVGGEHNYISGLASYGGRWNLVGAELQVLYKEFGGFRNNTNSATFDGTFKSNFHFSNNSILGVKINYFQEDGLATYTGLTKYMFEVDPRMNFKKDDVLEANRIAIDLSHDYMLSDNIMLLTKAYTNQYTRNWWRENDKFVKPDGSSIGSDYIGPVLRIGNGTNVGRLRVFQVAGIEERLTSDFSLFGIVSNLETGIRFHIERFRNKEIAGISAVARDGNLIKDEVSDAIAFSAFILHKISFDNFYFTPGLRIENFVQKRLEKWDNKSKLQIERLSKNYTIEFLPGIGVLYNLDNLTFFGGIHRGFTPPTLGTAFMNAAEAVNYTGDKDNLDSEKSWNYELGFRFTYLNHSKLDISYFRMDIRDMVDAGRDAIFQNLGKVKYEGVESSFELDLKKITNNLLPFTFDGNYTFLNGRIVDAVVLERPFAVSKKVDTIDVSGKFTPYSPKHTLQLGINIKLDFGLDLRFDYRYVSMQYTDFANTFEESEDGSVGALPSYYYFNLCTSYFIHKFGLILYLTIKNIFNDVYRGSRISRTSSGIFPDGFRQTNFGIKYQL